MLWVRIPATYTGYFFHFNFLLNCIVCLIRPKINEKEAGVGPFFKNVKVNKVVALGHDVW